MSIHEHSNNIRTVGMGEFIAVLNGVEFRTRHNDYSLSMPSRTSTKYNAVEDIPFPPVPPEVSIGQLFHLMKHASKATYKQQAIPWQEQAIGAYQLCCLLYWQ